MLQKKEQIEQKLSLFKRRYYLNLTLRGVIISAATVLSVFLVINTLEYSFRFGSVVRALLLLVLIVAGIYTMYKFVVTHLVRLINKKSEMDDEEAARKIGSFFPEIDDRLLNIVQLKKSNISQQSSLIEASVAQKEKSVNPFNFEEAIDFKENKRYLKYLYAPLLIVITILLVSPTFISSSTERIVRFNKDFIPAAPFTFDLQNEELLAFKNEDFSISLQLKGVAIPENIYLNTGERKYKMYPMENGTFNYTFKKIQDSKRFKFEAAGYNSSEYFIEVVNRPGLKNFNVYLDYPNYLNKANELLFNVGNLLIPEGTRVKWQLKTLDAEAVALHFENNSEKYDLEVSDNQLFEFEKAFKRPDLYGISLSNKHSNNKDKILYKIDIIPDQYPQINLAAYQDTTFYSFIALSGNIADDYGLTKLKLYYQVSKNNQSADYLSVDIAINKNQTSQRFYYQWFIDSLQIKEGNRLKYYLQVWDNDGVNGQKSSKTGIYEFKIPTREELKAEIAETTVKTENEIDKTIKEAKELQEKLEEAEKRLKGKKELNWQDENLLKDIIQKREELNKAIEELKEQNKDNSSKRERFNEQNKNIKEKVERLQELMDELLDEETKKLYEELKKLLEEQKNIDDIQDLLNKMNNKENNLEKELERTLELFKRMKFDHKLDEAINDLNEQIEKQEELIEETDNKEKNTEELSQKQEELQSDFEKFEKDMEEIQELNQELKNPESMPDTQREQESVKEEQQKAKESLDQNKRNPSKQSQQKAKEKMQEMAEKMEQMQSSMEMTMMQENLDDLRDIVHNLIKLSFDQEDLMNEFRDVKQSDPRFVELSQKQLKLKDDAKIVEDSLLSLANRVFQIQSFVTREVSDMNEHMDKSVDAIRERKKPLAVSEQQFAMTSMNNLALLLDDVLQQMQNAMADAMGKPQKGKGQKNSMTLSELQQQLNGQIEDLKKSGKSGRELSEELAKLAAEQERIRKALEQMQEQYGEGDNGLKPGDGIPQKMEETEIDLVNKQITEETIKRQKEIMTRLLEAENAMREREMDEERKGETAKDYDKALPKVFEEYFKLKEKEIELLKTIPPKLYPYYKKEVNDYFKRIENGPNN